MASKELASHPHVLEVSVVARAHPKWGERPMAFVILLPEYAQTWFGNHAGFEAELKRHARTLLPGFACPEWVQVVDKLPVNVSYLDLLNMLMPAFIENIHWQDLEN